MKNYLRNDEGSVALIAAVAMLVVFGCAALVVDIGMVYVARMEVQAAADAAALAGAQELPVTETATSVANSFALANSSPGVVVTIVTPYDGDPDMIEVTCSRPVNYVFAPVLGIDEGDVIARAVGRRHTEWSGEALPFLNLDDDYSTDSQIVIWEKTDPGDFESIDNFTIHNPADPETIYFSVDYMGGIELKKGVVATIKQEIGYIFDRHHPNIPVYALSIRADLLAAGQIMLIDGTMRDLDDLKNNDLVHPSQLVLLECTFDAYDDSAKKLELTVLNMYDFYAGEFPPDYTGPVGQSGSVLSD